MSGPPGRVAPSLELCRGCNQFVHAHERDCPHCGANVAAARAGHEAALREVRQAVARVEALFRRPPEAPREPTE